MIGTNFSVTEAIRFIPPIKIKPARTARTAPTIFVSTLKASLKALLIELACTILPIKPNANIMEIAKKAAKNFEKTLLPNPREM